jgi:hypothetical protein
VGILCNNGPIRLKKDILDKQQAPTHLDKVKSIPLSKAGSPTPSRSVLYSPAKAEDSAYDGSRSLFEWLSLLFGRLPCLYGPSEGGDSMTQEGTKRKLAAILSADVMEYSRLMSQDERGTIRTLKLTFRSF